MDERTVKLVPNQKLIIVNKAVSNKQNLYCVLNLAALDKASKTLQSKAGFKLFIYLAKNQQNYTFALSGKAFEEWSGFGKTSYDTAVQELLDNGYLVKHDGKKQTYDFFEYGIDKSTIPRVTKEAEDNGFHF